MAARIPYDSLTLRAVAEELARDLTGGVVQHVAQPADTDLVVTVRSRGANWLLLLSWDASFARVHLTSVRRANPPAPPAFCMLCRKYLEGARVVTVAQRGFDRVLDISLDAGGVSLTLTAELMGKHSNVILWTDEGVVLDAAKRIPRRLSRYREVLPGKPYVAPPAQADRADPFAAERATIEALECDWPADEEARSAVLMGRFAGMSPFLARELTLRAGRAPLWEAWNELIGAAGRGEWAPVVVRDERHEPVGAYPFPTVQHPAALQHPRDSIDTALDHFYSIALPRFERDTVRRELDGAIAAALRARGRQRESLERALAESSRADEYRQTGELLLANLHAIPPEATSASLADYYAADGSERAVSLDPTLTARENADAYFRRYRKAREGADALSRQLERVAREYSRLETAREDLAGAGDAQAIAALRAELTATGLLRAEARSASRTGQAVPEFDGHRIRVFTSPDGWEILLGENEAANGYLVGRVAAPDDLWLHVRANVSAHVVIRTRRTPAAVPPSVIRQAALLAARHSPAKHSSTVPVDYTLRKYVRRPRGAAPGTVLYQHEKTIYVEPAEGRS